MVYELSEIIYVKRTSGLLSCLFSRVLHWIARIQIHAEYVLESYKMHLSILKVMNSNKSFKSRNILKYSIVEDLQTNNHAFNASSPNEPEQKHPIKTKRKYQKERYRKWEMLIENFPIDSSIDDVFKEYIKFTSIRNVIRCIREISLFYYENCLDELGYYASLPLKFDKDIQFFGLKPKIKPLYNMNIEKRQKALLKHVIRLTEEDILLQYMVKGQVINRVYLRKLQKRILKSSDFRVTRIDPLLHRWRIPIKYFKPIDSEKNQIPKSIPKFLLDPAENYFSIPTNMRTLQKAKLNMHGMMMMPIVRATTSEFNSYQTIKMYNIDKLSLIIETEKYDNVQRVHGSNAMITEKEANKFDSIKGNICKIEFTPENVITHQPIKSPTLWKREYECIKIDRPNFTDTIEGEDFENIACMNAEEATLFDSIKQVEVIESTAFMNKEEAKLLDSIINNEEIESMAFTNEEEAEFFHSIKYACINCLDDMDEELIDLSTISESVMTTMENSKILHGPASLHVVITYISKQYQIEGIPNQLLEFNQCPVNVFRIQKKCKEKPSLISSNDSVSFLNIYKNAIENNKKYCKNSEVSTERQWEDKTVRPKLKVWMKKEFSSIHQVKNNIKREFQNSLKSVEKDPLLQIHKSSRDHYEKPQNSLKNLRNTNITNQKRDLSNQFTNFIEDPYAYNNRSTKTFIKKNVKKTAKIITDTQGIKKITNKHCIPSINFEIEKHDNFLRMKSPKSKNYERLNFSPSVYSRQNNAQIVREGRNKDQIQITKKQDYLKINKVLSNQKVYKH